MQALTASSKRLGKGNNSHNIIMIFIVAAPTLHNFLGSWSAIVIYQTLLSLARACVCACTYIVKGLGTRLRHILLMLDSQYSGAYLLSISYVKRQKIIIASIPGLLPSSRNGKRKIYTRVIMFVRESIR